MPRRIRSQVHLCQLCGREFSYLFPGARGGTIFVSPARRWDGHTTQQEAGEQQLPDLYALHDFSERSSHRFPCLGFPE